ncbi:twin-arginine translocation signal domain-containing protein [Halorussus marinus]|uniref:twin-arginine translocation signal domain-containing protein n=1 Tax=Halorussus marinus TaxID=2505976 RepID=UPI00143D757C|nr:twin-arginine translocation signal domain-containing protein [Halorussus marinus]
MAREDTTEDVDDSRRSFMKKGALASSAAALGLASSGSVAGDTLKQQDGVQQASTGLVFVDDYKPGVEFEAVSRVQQPTVNQILGYVDPSQQGEDGNQQQSQAVVDPTDWNGYIFNYTGCGPGNYNLVFLREGALAEGETYSFTTSAVFFDNEVQLLESQIQSGGGGGGDGGGDGGDGGGENGGDGDNEEGGGG